MRTSGSPRYVATNRQQQSAPIEGPDPSIQTLAELQTGLHPQVVLFGDSITQQSSLTLGSRLQNLYVRRADVVNRGFSGYTSSLALQALPYILPLPSPYSLPTTQPPIRLLTVFFGANDAALPGNAQHVPLLTYTADLRQILEYPLFKHHGTKIVLITPAPVNEWQLTKPLTRTATNARCYAQAARDLAHQMQIPCVDLWTAFIKLATAEPASIEHLEQPSVIGKTVVNECANTLAHNVPPLEDTIEEIPGSLSAPPNETLASLLSDGLHFSPRGYEVLYDELMAVIQEQVPECLPENMPFVFRPWRDILLKETEAQFDGNGVDTSDDSFVVIDDDVEMDGEIDDGSASAGGGGGHGGVNEAGHCVGSTVIKVTDKDNFDAFQDDPLHQTV